MTQPLPQPPIADPKFINHIVGKKELKNLIAWAFTNHGTSTAAEVADLLKTLGFRYATQSGISISVDDLEVPPTKRALLAEAEAKIEATKQRYARGEITEVERFQKVIDTWNITNEELKNQVVKNFKTNNPLNSVYMMSTSGARGNLSQVRQLVGMRGLMANPSGEVIDLPIKTNFREGLTVTEYIISSYGARKGLVDTALRTADSGYLTRRLVDVSQDVIIREVECGTIRGTPLRAMRDGDRVMVKLSDRLFGRVLAREVLEPGQPERIMALPLAEEEDRHWAIPVQALDQDLATALFPPENLIDEVLIDEAIGEEFHYTFWVLTRAIAQQLVAHGITEVPVRPVLRGAYRNQDINDELAKYIEKRGVQEVVVRSTLTCDSTRSVCQMCYGWSLAHNHLVDVGEAVGIIAAQSIGEPGTQLTMRTFHTGGVVTGEVAQQKRAAFAGTVKLPKKLKLRALRTRHGDDALVVEDKGETEVVLIGKGGQEDKFIVVQGSLFFVKDGQTVDKDELIAEIPAGGRAGRKTVEKATKDLNTDVAGEVYFAQLVPEEKKDRQGNTSYVAAQGGLIWILSGEVYNLPPGAEPVIRNDDQVDVGSVLTVTKFITEHGGTVRLNPSVHRNVLEVEIITASVILDQARIEEEQSQGQRHYILETGNGQRFSVTATPGTKVANNQVVAELIDTTYLTQSGGIIKYAGVEVARRGRGLKQGFEVVKGGTLLWIPEEAQDVNKDISLLLVEDSQYVEAGTEVVKDIFCQSSGMVEVKQRDDILRELVIKPGELFIIDDLQMAEQKHDTLAYPGTEVLPGVIVEELRYVEFVETSEGPALLLRPVQEFAVPDSPPVPSQTASQQSGHAIGLKAVQRIPYRDGERVKSIEGLELLRTQLILEIDSNAPQLGADIEFDQSDPDNWRLRLVILESLAIRQQDNSDTTDNTIKTRLLVEEGDHIAPGAVVARSEILARQKGIVRGIRQDGESVRRLLIMPDSASLNIPCTDTTVQVGELLRTGDPVGATIVTPESGQIIGVSSDRVTLRRGRPYLVSPGAVLQVQHADLVQRGDNLALLVFERAKTGDIIQGLPRIEELLEGRKPKEMCVLAQRAGKVQMVYDSDDITEVKILELDGMITGYPIGIGQNLIVTDGQEIAAAERLTDGPANPHDILETFFAMYREDANIIGLAHQHLEDLKDFLTDRDDEAVERALRCLVNYEAARESFQRVQEFLVNEVQSVYQSQGVDISDKHIEVVVKQMTSKVRIDEGGETTRLQGELVDLNQVQQINEAMIITNRMSAEYTPVLMGITKASLNTDSFISAASFQETTRVLTEAAIEGKSDWLRGLKENVIIGRLIPAGTGFNAYENNLEDNHRDSPVLAEEVGDDVVIDDNSARNYPIERLQDELVDDYSAFTEGEEEEDV